MSQHGPVNDIPNRVDMGLGGAKIVINWNESPLIRDDLSSF